MTALATIWVGIIAFGIIMYVLLDGYDLGIGILFMFIKDSHQRDLMVSTILPVWDGNQTWLVFGGAALYGAFPSAFATVLPILYIPIIIMVVSLLFRGVAFEFRLKATRSKKLWDYSFLVGSLVAAFIQGTVLGSFIEGYKMNSGSFYQWFNPFSITCGMALIIGYMLLGSNRLIVKTVGELQKKCFNLSKILQFYILIFAVIVSVWSPLLDPALKARWFNPDYRMYLALLPLVTLLFFGLHFYGLRKSHDHIPFWSSLGIFLMCYVGFIISAYPYIVPRQMTYLQAATSSATLIFMTVGAAIMLPVLLFYTYYAHRIFRGKVTEVTSY